MFVVAVAVFFLVLGICLLIIKMADIHDKHQKKREEEETIKETRDMVVDAGNPGQCKHEWVPVRRLIYEFILEETPTAYKVCSANKYRCVYCDRVRFEMTDKTGEYTKWVFKNDVPPLTKFERQQ